MSLPTVCAVIVSFHPNEALLANVRALRPQVDELLIMDNASGPASADLLQRCAALGAQVRHLPDNIGIAAALNLAVEHARQQGHTWLATFDQDSRVSPDMLATLLTTYQQMPQPETVAALSPRYHNQRSGAILTSEAMRLPQDPALPWVEVFVVLTSGNLVKLSTFERVGLFNEAYFIDHVDTEFCLRCHAHGLKIMEIKAARLLHCIGEPSPVKIFDRLKHTSNHSALRRYYLTRNSLYMYRTFFWRFPAWITRNFLILLRAWAMVWFEPETPRKLRAILHGLWDGLRGKLGKARQTF